MTAVMTADGQADIRAFNRSVVCPRCAASAGEPCRSQAGKIVMTHVTRWQQAWVAEYHRTGELPPWDRPRV